MKKFGIKEVVATGISEQHSLSCLQRCRFHWELFLTLHYSQEQQSLHF